MCKWYNTETENEIRFDSRNSALNVPQTADSVQNMAIRNEPISPTFKET